MKASLKFREDQKPLIRAKIPLSILGLPFQSGIVAGESKELSLNLATFFESGPTIKVAYRPNDTWNPFSVVVKTGTGFFGSPISSSMVMSAEFNLIGKASPIFMLHFKPQFGDFSIKKSQSSSVFEKRVTSLTNCAVSDDDASIEVVESPPPAVNGNDGGGFFSGKTVTVLQPAPATASAIAAVISGVEVAARTKLPVRSRAVMNFRWGVRVPAEVRSGGGGGGESMAGINFRRIPFLVMNKIGIEHVDGGDSKKSNGAITAKVGPEFGNADVAEACLAVKRQLEVLQSENGLLKKAVDDLRQEIATNNKNRIERRSGNEKKSMEEDVNGELRKALKAATAGSGT